MIREGDIMIHRDSGKKIRVIEISVGEMYYVILSSGTCTHVSLNTAELCLRDGTYYLNEVERAKLILKQYE
jgi:hypothetical protein